MSASLLNRSLLRKVGIATAVCLAAPMTLLGTSMATAAPLDAPGAVGTAYHVSCGAGGGDGTGASPFGSLAQANSVDLGPGDQLLFERGTTCVGTLAPKGAGSADAPVFIGAYGEGELPRLDGNGAHDTVLLQNMEHLSIQDLEIINAANPGSERNGVRLVLSDFGQGTGYKLRNLEIHNVRGGDTKALGGSSGIHVAVTGGTEATWYDDLEISNNRIYDVDREGIYFKSTWNKRPEVGGQDYTGLGPWTPSTNVVVEGNDLSSIAGDGIKIDTTQDAAVRNNKVAGFQLRSKQANAGIWTFNADDTVVSGNDVSGGGNTLDGMSFDADGGSQRTVFEYNYSHDNAGGLLLLCPYSGAFTYGTVMRYNISYNDGERIFQLCPGDIQGTEIYNNTIVNDTVTPKKFLQDDNSIKRGITWRNNVVLNRGSDMAIDHRGPGFTFGHNLLAGVETVPANADGRTNPGGLSTDPGLLDTSRQPSGIGDLGGFRLRTGSAALGSGAVIADNGGRDFFGNPVSATEAPNMGAYQGAGIKDNARPASIALADRTMNIPAATSFLVEAEVHWWSNSNSAGARADLAVPAGWTAVPLETSIPKGAKPGDSVALSWRVTPASDAVNGDYALTANIRLGNAVKASASSTVTVSPLYSDLAAAFNRVAVTDDFNTTAGELALSNSSLSAQALFATKGIAPGAMVDGANVTYAWPAFVPGSANAVRAEGQNISVQAQGSNLSFVVFGINGSPTGTGKVSYTDGTASNFTLAAGDYYYNKPAAGNSDFAVMDYRNIPAGKDNRKVTIYESTIALDAGKTVAYVTLPQMQPQADGKTPGMFVMAMGVGK